jgi:hypothetical protein
VTVAGLSPFGALVVAAVLAIGLLAVAGILLNVPPVAVGAGVVVLLWALGRTVRRRRARSGPGE